MIEFGGENKEINEKCKSAPFLLSLEDTPDNILRIVIAFPMEGEKKWLILTVFQSLTNPGLRICLFMHALCMKIWIKSMRLSLMIT